MRKGEEKRLELLNTAERLFCANGYEATSVQDILDVLHLSKGGFYHHFASKEEVLRALCSRRAERAAAYTAAALEAAEGAMERVNAILRGFLPLRPEETDFLAMLRPYITKPEGRAIAMVYQDALQASFLPLLRRELAAAAAAKVIYPPVKDAETVLLHLISHCWMEAVGTTAQDGGRRDALTLIGKYRRMAEVMLDAPYGSVELIRAEELDAAVRQLEAAL